MQPATPALMAITWQRARTPNAPAPPTAVLHNNNMAANTVGRGVHGRQHAPIQSSASPRRAPCAGARSRALWPPRPRTSVCRNARHGRAGGGSIRAWMRHACSREHEARRHGAKSGCSRGRFSPPSRARVARPGGLRDCPAHAASDRHAGRGGGAWRKMVKLRATRQPPGGMRRCSPRPHHSWGSCANAPGRRTRPPRAPRCCTRTTWRSTPSFAACTGDNTHQSNPLHHADVPHVPAHALAHFGCRDRERQFFDSRGIEKRAP